MRALVLDTALHPAFHLGPLHPVEHILVYALAFGPLLLLAVTVWISRRRSAETPQPGELRHLPGATRRPDRRSTP